MKRSIIFLVGLAGLSTGCAHEAFTNGGVVGSATGTTIDGMVTTDDSLTACTDSPGNRVTTIDHSLVMDVSYQILDALGHPQTQSYHTLIGPNSAVVLRSTGTLDVCDGWAYVWTDTPPPIILMPWVETMHVEGGAEGCDFAVHLNTTAGVKSTRMYYFAGMNTTAVTKPSHARSARITQAGQYILGESGEQLTTKPLPASSAEKRQWLDMKDRADRAKRLP